MQTAKDLADGFDHKFPNGQVYAIDGVTLLANDTLIYPCGSIAKFIFDDQVEITVDGETIELKQEDID